MGKGKDKNRVSIGVTWRLVMKQTWIKRKREKIKIINTDDEKKINTQSVRQRILQSTGVPPLVTTDPVGTSHHEFNRIVHRPEQALDSASVTPALLISENHGLMRLEGQQTGQTTNERSRTC